MMEKLWVLITGGLLSLSLTAVFFWVPPAQGLGWDFKIFFFHVPAAWLMLISAAVSGGAGVSTLATGRGEALSSGAATLAFVFGLMVMTSGPVWAWRAWGVFWIWEPRLTTSLVCWLTFAGSTLISGYGGRSRRVLPLALNILGALNVPLVYVSVAFWGGGHHPPTHVVPELEGRYAITLALCVLTMTSVWGLLLRETVQLNSLREQISELVARSRTLRHLRAKSPLMIVALSLASWLALGVVGSPSLAHQPPNPVSQPSGSKESRSKKPPPEARDTQKRSPRQNGSGAQRDSQSLNQDHTPMSLQTLAGVLSVYLFLWGLLLLYLLRLRGKTRQLKKKVEWLQARLTRPSDLEKGTLPQADVEALAPNSTRETAKKRRGQNPKMEANKKHMEKD